MNVLLFGAGGQAGRALAAAVPSYVNLCELARAECDVTDAEAVRRAIGEASPDIVVNASGYTRVDMAESEPDRAEQLNAIAPGWIATAARETGGRMIHISTDFVFDGRASRPYQPEDATGPVNQYGRTKLLGEHAVAAADPDFLIVRTAWLYDARASNFLTTILRLAQDRDRLTIVDDQVGTPTAAASLATALWDLIHAKARGLYHYTDAGVASWYDFAVAITEEARSLGLLQAPGRVEPIATSDYPTTARRPAYSVLDKSATWRLLGRASPHWRTSLRAVLHEVKEHG